MNTRFFSVLSGALGVGALVLCTSLVFPQEPSTGSGERGIFDQQKVAQSGDLPTEKGVEPLARGPVHEAFAEPTTANPAPSPVVPQQPPNAITEVPTSDKPDGGNVQWIPGYYSWDDETSHFIWVTGIWRAIPPGRLWVPGHWAQVKDGWQFVSGFWSPEDNTDLKIVPAPPDAPQEEVPPAPGTTTTAQGATTTPTPGGTPPAAGTGTPSGTAPAQDSSPGTQSPDGENVFVPGIYVYQQDHFVWRPGYWVTYRPGWIWVPARYVYTPAGCIFVEGFWDYDIQRRGLLFAPVAIDPDVAAQPGWTYTPTYVVHDECIMDSLFVRGNCGCYFFGDFYAHAYEQQGYVSWADYRFGQRGFDPLFGYYRWEHHHAHDTHWEKDLRGLFAGRRSGDVARPPRTLAQQQKLMQSGKGFNAQRQVFLGSINQVNRNVVKLQKLDQAGLNLQQNRANQFRTLSKERNQAENRLVQQGLSANHKGASAQTLQLNFKQGNPGRNQQVGSGNPGNGNPGNGPIGDKGSTKGSQGLGGTNPIGGNGLGKKVTDLGNQGGTPPNGKGSGDRFDPKGAKLPGGNNPIGGNGNGPGKITNLGNQGGTLPNGNGKGPSDKFDPKGSTLPGGTNPISGNGNGPGKITNLGNQGGDQGRGGLRLDQGRQPSGTNFIQTPGGQNGQNPLSLSGNGGGPRTNFTQGGQNGQSQFGSAGVTPTFRGSSGGNGIRTPQLVTPSNGFQGNSTPRSDFSLPSSRFGRSFSTPPTGGNSIGSGGSSGRKGR